MTVIPFPGSDDDGDHAHARNSDPDTSHRAAASHSSERIRANQAAVLRVLRQGPCDDATLARRYASTGERPQSPSGLRTRRRELVDKGLVEWTGETVPTESGRGNRAKVWRAVNAPQASPEPSLADRIQQMLDDYYRRRQD